ncbi:hypothetical protein FF2_046099 [Malus domestica]
MRIRGRTEPLVVEEHGDAVAVRFSTPAWVRRLTTRATSGLRGVHMCSMWKSIRRGSCPGRHKGCSDAVGEGVD